MIEVIIIFFSIYGLTWSLQNAELLSIPRNWIMRHSVFAFKLLSCPFCVGFHSGWIIYLLTQSSPAIIFFILWGFAGAAISLILSGLTNRLFSN